MDLRPLQNEWSDIIRYTQPYHDVDDLLEDRIEGNRFITQVVDL